MIRRALAALAVLATFSAPAGGRGPRDRACIRPRLQRRGLPLRRREARRHGRCRVHPGRHPRRPACARRRVDACREGVGGCDGHRRTGRRVRRRRRGDRRLDAEHRPRRRSAGGPQLQYRAAIRGADADGRWGAPRTLGRTGHFIDGQPRLATNARGDAVVLWRGLRGSGSRARTCCRPPTGPPAARSDARGHSASRASTSRSRWTTAERPTRRGRTREPRPSSRRRSGSRGACAAARGRARTPSPPSAAAARRSPSPATAASWSHSAAASRASAPPVPASPWSPSARPRVAASLRCCPRTRVPSAHSSPSAPPVRP